MFYSYFSFFDTKHFKCVIMIFLPIFPSHIITDIQDKKQNEKPKGRIF